MATQPLPTSTTPVESHKKMQLTNATADTSQSLQDFVLPDLQQFTREGVYSNNASKDFHLFYVGRDNVHEVLKYVLSRTRVSLYMNMFGYDDDELNQIIMEKIADPTVTVVITLDKSQAAGAHEKALLDQDQKGNLAAFNSHITIGQSATHQISHTKGFVADGKVGGEGSVNWSASGEGEFPAGAWQVTGTNTPAGPVDPGKGYKAQNNTQSVFTDSDTINRFQTELIAEHLIAQKQQLTKATTPPTPAQKTEVKKALAIKGAKTATKGAKSTSAAKKK